MVNDGYSMMDTNTNINSNKDVSNEHDYEKNDDTPKSFHKKLFKIKLFNGIIKDLQDRLPLYKSDWLDSWNYRVIPATILTFFTNIFPAIAFAQDMFDKTDNSYGVNEVLLSSAIGGIVFGIFSGQPLTIVGVTGPITIFNYTVYEIMKPHSKDAKFFPFMFWISIWGMIFHFVISITNCVNALKFVTQFPCDIFGLFINIVYLQKGVQILTRQFHPEDNGSSGFASCTLAISMGILGVTGNLANRTKLFNYHIRQFIVDYSTPGLIVFFTGFIHFGGYLDNVNFEKLPITKSFRPTLRDNWIDVTGLPIKYIFLALPFGIILAILFYFDHSISSLMAQDLKFKLKKPASFHYDLFLLGIVTGISGVLGIPCPNGLIPQAPLHTESLVIRNKFNNEIIGTVEQRFTNTVQGLMLLGMMTRPLLICLGLIPQCVLAGLFFIMGTTGLINNEIINRIRFIFSQDDSLNLKFVPKRKLYLFVCFSLIGFIAEFGIVNTKGAIGFPLVLLLSVIGAMWFKWIFTVEELEILDGPVAHENTLKNLL
ncbi:Sodium-driven chloride bicarbonate exchanger [Wickerhamomyces ciferrii]|uniref:Sodium-driven chloride bicarbonate exchanger n=1 Tax=Wickerhamomyces ciferrii (strain ATCC 14091 / BCRC 22168 / CBS 111 / JCM 3599 / NBRC 0793 / NRRL Y-1031 F-60-10) TaxID=1206466 RepID=K0KXN7_WICCF|nr:Sodium-driven chloride bicarbonate exchanger [Wickerhamomyces ciferrii]CCH45818.1 Sodium-driven chloride bicarbonate exchanger [Wickerhamomyces ciferrii]